MMDIDIKYHYDACKNVALTAWHIKDDNQTYLNILKQEYKDIINSPRTYEYINDLKSLMAVLEQRNALNYADIHVLENMYEVLNIQKKRILDDYKKVIKRKLAMLRPTTFKVEDIENQPPPCNTSIQRPTSAHKFHEHFQNAKPQEDVNLSRQRLSERVITEISTRIGGSWKELARYLKVQESVIHGISRDPSLRSNEARTRVMLQEYENRIDPLELKTKLINALDLAGRRDLRDDVLKWFLRET